MEFYSISKTQNDTVKTFRSVGLQRGNQSGQTQGEDALCQGIALGQTESPLLIHKSTNTRNTNHLFLLPME